MADGVYLFPRCTPTGDVGLGSASADAEVSRDWTFTCNGEPTVPSYLTQGTHDPRNFVIGNDCEVVVNGVVMTEATVVDATFGANALDYVPLGTRQVLRRRTSDDITVTLTERKTRDFLFKLFMDSRVAKRPMEVDILVRHRGPAS